MATEAKATTNFIWGTGRRKTAVAQVRLRDGNGKIEINGRPARQEPCLQETVCASGAVRGRSEVFVRIVGPKPNGFLWPNLVKFTTSRVEVWIQQVSTGAEKHYVLPAVSPDSDDLTGFFDRTGFLP